MILETIPAIQDLTVDQKLRLVWELWADVSRQGAGISSDASSLLEERLELYDADPNRIKTTDEVTAGIMQLKKKLAATRQ